VLLFDYTGSAGLAHQSGTDLDHTAAAAAACIRLHNKERVIAINQHLSNLSRDTMTRRVRNGRKRYSVKTDLTSLQACNGNNNNAIISQQSMITLIAS